MTCCRNYPTDLKGHWLLPRWWIFQQVVSVFESSKRSVPVFNGEPRRRHHDVTTDTTHCAPTDRPRGRIIMIVRIALVKMGSKNRGINYTLIIPGSLTQSCLMKTWLSPILRLRLGLGARRGRHASALRRSRAQGAAESLTCRSGISNTLSSTRSTREII